MFHRTEIPMIDPLTNPERTLNRDEIDGLIATTLDREAMATDQARRAAWRRTVENAASFTTSDGAVSR
jgi:hypothetical protein